MRDAGLCTHTSLRTQFLYLSPAKTYAVDLGTPGHLAVAVRLQLKLKFIHTTRWCAMSLTIRVP